MKIIMQFLLMGAAVAISAYLLPGVEVANFGVAILVAVVIALLNSTIGRVLRTLTLPLNWLTLGLVSAIITVLMILLASNLLSGFNAGGFINAALFAIILAIVSSVLGTITK